MFQAAVVLISVVNLDIFTLAHVEIDSSVLINEHRVAHVDKFDTGVRTAGGCCRKKGFIQLSFESTDDLTPIDPHLVPNPKSYAAEQLLIQNSETK